MEKGKKSIKSLYFILIVLKIYKNYYTELFSELFYL